MPYHLTRQHISNLDQDPSLEQSSQKVALASVAALVLHFSWPSEPFSSFDKFDWILLLWKSPTVVSTLFPILILLSSAESTHEKFFSHSEDNNSGVITRKRTSIDQEREDRNFFTNLIITVISALHVTMIGAKLLFDILNAAWPTPKRDFGDLGGNFFVSMITFGFLLFVLVCWIPVMNLWGMRQDLPPAQKSPRNVDATTEDEIPRVTDLFARLDKCEESLRGIGLEQAAVKELLAKLRSEGDSDTPTSE